MTLNPKGMYGMWCWNSLSTAQQLRLIHHGNLPIDFQPEGETCLEDAQCEITTVDDQSPGPRFYCYRCAVAYLRGMSRR